MFDGAMIRAWPGGSESRPRRPRFRVAESNAGSSVVATGSPVRSLNEPEGPALRGADEGSVPSEKDSIDRRYPGMPVRMIGIRSRYLTGCPFRVAGLNFQAFAAATSMRS